MVFGLATDRPSVIETANASIESPIAIRIMSGRLMRHFTAGRRAEQAGSQ